LPRARAQEILSNLERYRQYIAPSIPRGDWVERTPGGSVSNMYFPSRVDPFFEALGSWSTLVDLAQRASGRSVAYLGSEAFDKPARTGPAALPHQDGIYWVDTDVEIAHVWLPLDEVTRGNGALLYWPGSHLPGTVAHETIPGTGRQRVTRSLMEALGPPLIACAEPGDAIFHHSDIVHGSLPNVSEASRRAINVAYDPAVSPFTCW